MWYFWLALRKAGPQLKLTALLMDTWISVANFMVIIQQLSRHYTLNYKWRPHGGTRGKHVSTGDLEHLSKIANEIIVDIFQLELKWRTNRSAGTLIELSSVGKCWSAVCVWVSTIWGLNPSNIIWAFQPIWSDDFCLPCFVLRIKGFLFPLLAF